MTSARRLDLLLYALSGVFALVTALTSTLLPHRAWGAIAAWGYLAAFLLVLVPRLHRRRLLLTWLAYGAVTLLPLIVEAVQRAGGRTDRAQEEVLVVERMGARLASTGTPYLSHDAIAALPSSSQLDAYSPYQPGMALFGLPRALGSFWFTDARIWFFVVTAAALFLAMRLFPSASALQFAAVFPICALTLATGGDDLPVLALSLLAVVLFSSSRFALAGVAVGAAAALKLFAFPVVAVLAVLAVVTGHGRRFLPFALGLPVLALVPPLLVNADALIENVIRFPLGHGLVSSPAQSPFPGQLIASSVPGGRYIAAGLLVAAALAIGVLLVLRPPRTAASAALFSGYGLLAAILLMPTTRFGYLLYPVALLVWGFTLRRHTGTRAPGRDAALYRQ